MLELEDLIDFKNVWFYIATGTTFFTGVTSIYIHGHIQNNPRKSGLCQFLMTLLLVLFLVDNAIFIIAVRQCPHGFLTYLFSVYLPLILLVVSIIGPIILFIKSLRYGWTSDALSEFSGGIFFSIGIKVSFALTYGSLCGLMWILFDFILTLIKVMLLPEPLRTYTKLKDD